MDRTKGQQIAQWFNTAAFTTNAIGTFGNAGKNILRGPRFFNTDLGLIKNTRVTERTSVQFRAEFFNVFNHPQFSNPANNAALPTLGQITSASVNPRLVQLALKYVF